MQLKGISRKTILKSFSLLPNMDCTTEIVEKVVDRAAIEGTNIKRYARTEIEKAIEKADNIINRHAQKLVDFFSTDTTKVSPRIIDRTLKSQAKANKAVNELILKEKTID